MVNIPVCKAHRWFVPNSGEDGVALVKCLDCPTKQYQPLDGIKETTARANELNKKYHYPLIRAPEKVHHRETLHTVPAAVEAVTITKKEDPVPAVKITPAKPNQKRSAKRPRNHQWTEEEQGLVRLHYDGTRASVEKLMALIGCSRYGVKGQVAFLGLALSKQPNWSEKELHYIKIHYKKESVRVMAHALHRSMNSVKVKTSRLHFSLRSRDGWYTKKEVCEILGVDHHAAQRWIDSGDLKATYHTGRKPSQKGMAMWHIEAADLKTFIIGHCQEFQGRNIDLFCILKVLGVL